MNGQAHMRRLRKIRRDIDQIDRRILRLLSRRARMAVDAGSIKNTLRLPVMDQKREKQVISRIAAAGAHPMKKRDLVSIYRLLIAACRRLE